MSLPAAIAIYFVIWWLVLFVVLPWGHRDQSDLGPVVTGTVSSAPVRPYLWRKIIATTILAGLVMLALHSFLNAGLTFDDFPFPNPLTAHAARN